jgi:hypothetical protein
MSTKRHGTTKRSIGKHGNSPGIGGNKPTKIKATPKPRKAK